MVGLALSLSLPRGFFVSFFAVFFAVFLSLSRGGLCLIILNPPSAASWY